ncbi:MAG: hypothetical protein D6B25_10255 [Desulfobulbaceae bacterium]|nr:MAG: hypothetical protein D6B25_10255 [Desulfobulbaceae bacterium]
MDIRFKDRLRPHIVKSLQKTKLNRLAHKLYYSYVHGFNTANDAVLEAQEKCFEHALSSGVARSGDYMEFGIFKGYAFWHAQKIAVEQGLDQMRFFGCDSFAGLPEVQGSDICKNDTFYEGQYACDKKTVIENLNSKNVDWTRTHLIEGYFNESLTAELIETHQLKKIAIALIDCDLYASTIDVLNFIDPMVQDQTIFMFDDWNCYDRNDEKGQRKAFREFLEKHPNLKAEPFFEYGAYGQVFIIGVES